METREQETSTRQKAQEELVHEAEKQPGVTEAMTAYRAFAPYVAAPTVVVPATTSYATGGNAPVDPHRA
jgi:hypothetical protein